jgi:hypothetical protein
MSKKYTCNYITVSTLQQHSPVLQMSLHIFHIPLKYITYITTIAVIKPITDNNLKLCAVLCIPTDPAVIFPELIYYTLVFY